MKPKAFQINLPHPRTSKEIIFDYYEIPLDESSPSKIATCKKCKEGIKIIQGSNIYSSFTVGLNFHLRKHLAEWEDYLHKLSKIMTPDSKTICEHSVANKRLRFNTNREESARNVREVNVNSEINRKSKNVAGVCYIPRDCEVLKGKVAEGDIPKILRHLHPFTNKNVHIFELLGTKHENAPLRANYKMSKCLVDNNGDITLDLQRLLCHNVCFFDPEIYGECEHDGNIDLFNDVEYQNSYEGFKLEIEKYPDFQVEKSFDSTILKEVRIIEHDKTAVREMRRLIIIILTLMICQQENIKKKTQQIMDLATGEDNIRKPDLGIFLWGPKVKDVDAKVQDDVTIHYDEEYSILMFTRIQKTVQPTRMKRMLFIRRCFMMKGKSITHATLEDAVRNAPVFHAIVRITKNQILSGVQIIILIILKCLMNRRIFQFTEENISTHTHLHPYMNDQRLTKRNVLLR